MALPALAVAGIAGGIKALGGLFGNKKKKKEAEARHQAQMAKYNNWSQGSKMRRSLISGLAKAHGVEGMLPPGVLDSFMNTQFSAPTKEYTPSGLGSFAGDFLSGGADYIGTPGSAADLVKGRAGATVTGAGSPLGSTGFGAPSAGDAAGGAFGSPSSGIGDALRKGIFG
jgi:hypothetical protein